MKLQEYYRSHLQVIESVFGSDWLDKARPKSKHPIQRLWRECGIAIDKLGSLSQDIPFLELADMNEISRYLARVSKLNSFNDCWLKHCKNDPAQYQSFLYELFVAGYLLRIGNRVAFVPRQGNDGTKTPDLEVSNDDATINIECKFRERLTPVRLSTNESNFIGEQLSKSFKTVRANFDLIILFVANPTESLVIETIEYAVRLADRGFCGEAHHNDGSAWVFISERPPPPRPSHQKLS